MSIKNIKTSFFSSLAKVGFQIDEFPTVDSFLKYKGQVPDMTQFAVCFRIQMIQLRQTVPFLSYAIDDFDNEIVIGKMCYKTKQFFVVQYYICSNLIKFLK